MEEPKSEQPEQQQQNAPASSIFGGMSPEQIMATAIMESCVAKAALSTGAGILFYHRSEFGTEIKIGFVLGGVFGTFMSSIDWNVNMDEYLKMSTKQQFRHTLRDMATRSYSTAKNFAVVGGMFAGTECLLETYRAKNDMYNGLAAGCSTGGILAARGM